MREQSESDSLQEQVYRQMQEKATEELITIWRENDRDAWTTEAFEAIEKILVVRLGRLPERELRSENEISDHENPVDEYPTDKRLIWIADWSDRLSWVILAVAIIYGGLRLMNYFQSSPYFQFSPSEWTRIGIFDGIIAIAGQLDSILYAGFTFLVLQAITEIIYLLMDIREIVQPEENQEETQPKITSD